MIPAAVSLSGDLSRLEATVGENEESVKADRMPSKPNEATQMSPEDAAALFPSNSVASEVQRMDRRVAGGEPAATPQTQC